METPGYFDDIKELFRETRQHQQETDRELKETGQLLREMGAETDRRMQETDRRMQETDRRMQETDRRLKALGAQIGGLGNRLGEFVEELVRPALVQMFAARGIPVHETLRDMAAKRNGEAGQIDLLVVNDTEVIAVEVKSKLCTEDVNEHAERLGKFRRLFPAYNKARLLGALAAMVIPDEVATYAMKQGFFLIGQKGDSAILLNDPSFEPRAF